MKEKKYRQLSLNLNFGINNEQACMLCHFSSECSGCCIKCKKDGCQGQNCSRPYKDIEGKRWEGWLYLIKTYKDMRRLLNYVTKEQIKKYHIDKYLRE